MLVNAQASNIEVSQSALTATPPEAAVRGERTLGALGWDTAPTSSNGSGKSKAIMSSRWCRASTPNLHP